VIEGRPHVRVSFRKVVSDGNYGSEAAEVMLEYEVEAGEEQTEFAEALLEQARARVHAELARSPSANVRRAAARAPMASVPPEADPDDDDLPY
jgi:hypothetical protein